MTLRAEHFSRAPVWLIAAVLCALAGCGGKRETGTPQEILDRGWKYFAVEQAAEAERCFNTVLESAADKSLRCQAAYGLAQVQSLLRHGQGSRRAVEFFKRVIALDPEGPLAAWAALGIVRDKHLPARSDASIPVEELKREYAQVIERYPGTPAADDAFLYRMSLYLQSLTAADAQVVVDETRTRLAITPTGNQASMLHHLAAQAYHTLNRHRESVEATIQSWETRVLEPTTPPNYNYEYYTIALAAEYDVGDFALARKYFQLFLKEFPTDQKAFTVRAELQRMDTIEAAGDPQAAPPVGRRARGPEARHE